MLTPQRAPRAARQRSGTRWLDSRWTLPGPDRLPRRMEMVFHRAPTDPVQTAIDVALRPPVSVIQSAELP